MTRGSSCVIIGTGSYLPKNIVTNQQLEQSVDTTDEWIVSRTGIKQRHLIAPDETTSTMAVHAAKAAIASASITNDTIDLIIVATTTPDNTFPSTATKVQAALNIHHGAAFDIQAVCAGFVYALSVAESMLQTGAARTALVIGADAMSRLVDWKDRATCVLFGDGAGAVILQRQEKAGNDRGILGSSLHSDGSFGSILYVNGGPGSNGQVGTLKMVGQEVFKHAVEKMVGCVDHLLARLKLTTNDIDWVVPHQANARILDAVCRKLAIPIEKLISTVEDHANTSAASIPLALDTAVKTNRLQPGQLVVMEAIGGGLCWGACVIRW